MDGWEQQGGNGFISFRLADFGLMVYLNRLKRQSSSQSHAPCLCESQDRRSLTVSKVVPPALYHTELNYSHVREHSFRYGHMYTPQKSRAFLTSEEEMFDF